MHILQKLYDDEINFSISCFYDQGFEVKLGDRVNGYHSEEWVDTFDEAVAWLEKEAIKHYPKAGDK